jgi:hypothetical protein
MELLEAVTHKVHDGYFVDLFVRQSNENAITMYNKVRGPSAPPCPGTHAAQCVRESNASAMPHPTPHS